MIPYWLAWLCGADRGKGPQTVEVWPRPDNWHQLEADGMTRAEQGKVLPPQGGAGVVGETKPGVRLLPRGGSGTSIGLIASTERLLKEALNPTPITPVELAKLAADNEVRRFNNEVCDTWGWSFRFEVRGQADADQVAERLRAAGWDCKVEYRTLVVKPAEPKGAA
jgi:hypothetical protein